MDRRTPSDYQTRTDNVHFIDAPTTTIYQPHVYELLRHLAGTSSVKRIIDIGCGSAEKLKGLDSKFDIICIDADPMREFVSKNLPNAKFYDYDLEKGAPILDESILINSIVVCSDVIEHLREPEFLIRSIAGMAQFASYVLVSTPDRVRARGFLDMGPPGNAAHTMEWTADELGRFMLDCGFPRNFLIGYTLNSDRDLSKSTILALAGKHATFEFLREKKNVSAVISVYNEEDILPSVTRHLSQQGVDVHIVDLFSNDSSFEMAKFLVENGDCKSAIRCPADLGRDQDQVKLSEFVAKYAKNLNSDWLILSDADEMLHSPWNGIGIVDAISFIDQLGYDAIGSLTLNFLFTQDEYGPTFFSEDYKFFEFERRPSQFKGISIHKNKSSSGNSLTEDDGRVFPLKFLCRHYPLRTKQQAEKKGRGERLEDIHRSAHEAGSGASGRVEPWRRFELSNFDFNVFYAECLVERLSGIGIETEERTIPNIASRFYRDELAAHEREALVQEAARLREENARFTDENARIVSENAKLHAHLDEIGRSRGWRLITAIREVRSRMGV